jgi:hypothetical protein
MKTLEEFQRVQNALRKPLNPDLAGYAALDAITTLEKNWKCALQDGASPQIIRSDLQETLNYLQESLKEATKILGPEQKSQPTPLKKDLTEGEKPYNQKS